MKEKINALIKKYHIEEVGSYKTPQTENKIKNMKRYVFTIILLISIAFTIHYFRDIYLPPKVVKVSIMQHDLLNKQYIVCKRARTTGFD